MFNQWHNCTLSNKAVFDYQRILHCNCLNLLIFLGETMYFFLKNRLKKTFLFIIFILHPSFGADNYEEEATKIEGLDYTLKKTIMFIDTSMPDDPSWWKELWPNPKDVVNSLGLESAMISVDLCCGYGYFTPFLAELSSKVYAIELDNELLEKARMENPSIKNCVWIQGDAMDIVNLIPEKVNFFFLANTLHCVP